MPDKASYHQLSDEDKITLAIECVAREQPIPHQLRDFLAEQQILELIRGPGTQ